MLLLQHELSPFRETRTLQFKTLSFVNRIHLCSYSISFKYRNLNNRVYNLCHEVHSKNHSTAIFGVPLHHMASHDLYN